MSELISLISRAVDIYELDPQTLEVFLDHDWFVNIEDELIDDQRKRLSRHREIKKREMFLKGLQEQKESLDFRSEARDLKEPRDSTQINLLRYFLARVESSAKEFELLEPILAIQLPVDLQAVVHDAHLNFVLGHFRTTAGLMGIGLEMALVQHLGKPHRRKGYRLDDLIEEAHDKRLIDDVQATSAGSIAEQRNYAVHTHSINSDWVYLLFTKFRDILAALYREESA